MTKSGARTASNLILVSAGVAAACVVLATPPLRRLAGAAARRWLGAGLPILVMEVRRAWIESGARTPVATMPAEASQAKTVN